MLDVSKKNFIFVADLQKRRETLYGLRRAFHYIY